MATLASMRDNLKRSLGSGNYGTVEELLNSFHLAAKRSQVEVYFGCFHPDGRFLGTDPQENWTMEEFFFYALPAFRNDGGWEYNPIEQSRKLSFFPSESAPVVSTKPATEPKKSSGPQTPCICTFDELLDSPGFKVTSRGSGTAVFDAEKRCWLILQYHLTFPIPNQACLSICERLRTYQESVSVEKAEQALEALLLDERREQLEQAAMPNNSKKSKSKRRSKK